MTLLRSSASLAIFVGTMLNACGASPAEVDPVLEQEPKPQLGLMTSLPLYWPLDADFGALASGEAEIPQQRGGFEHTHELVLLDTLSPIPAISQGQPDTDPLADLDFLAVIQPRVLTPSDNVALDNWVREGGQLLLALDPLLNGHYALPLGDPRRPVEAALIPPVIARWGLELRFDQGQTLERAELTLMDTNIPLELSGELREITGADIDCEFLGGGVLARCQVGDGQLTVIADAEVFKDDLLLDGHGHHDHSNHEVPPKADARISAIQALVRFAFESG